MTLQHDIHWLIEGVLIFSRTSGDGSIEEMGAIDARLLELIRVGTPPVHILSDLSNLGRMPFDVIGMQRNLKHMKDPNLGLIVVYGTTRLAANFLQLFASILGAKLRMARDYMHGLRMLAAEDVRVKAFLEQGKIPAEC